MQRATYFPLLTMTLCEFGGEEKELGWTIALVSPLKTVIYCKSIPPPHPIGKARS